MTLGSLLALLLVLAIIMGLIWKFGAPPVSTYALWIMVAILVFVALNAAGIIDVLGIRVGKGG